ncbi:HEAT repeat domain-containing protein (plasmid) [Streptomyces anulatus]|uniref:HEAT repeat domain-containing protein n=1 Tax=Streptomyces anulatus TaxID=1892 RepID=UPI002F91A13F|nr:HEAT repeat domain-containing protein [Streptomyces anulatus]
MGRDKKPGLAASATGEARAENGGIANTGILNVDKLYQYSPADDVPSEEAVTEAVEAYAQRVREVFGRLDLEVLTPLSEQGEHPVVELREIFVPPLVRADPPSVELPRELMKRLLEHGEITELGDLPPGADKETLERVRAAYQQRPPVAVLAMLAKAEADRVVLLGDPGAGKSTLARYLALTLTSQPVTGPLSPLTGKVPVVVELRRYADERWRDRTFEDFLEHLHDLEGMSVPRPVLEELLQQQRVVMVFDGLDELFDPAIRAETCRRIGAFAARHPGVRIVVTSRVIGYQRTVLDGAGFRHYMLQDLTESQIGEFARRWYTNSCPHDAPLVQSLVQRVTEAVAHSRPVRELAGNPLLLTILAIIGRRQTLPRDRQGVYKHAVTVLVAHWDRDAKQLTTTDVPEALEVLGAEERLELLRLLARRMQDGQGGIAGNHIHGRDLEAVFGEYLSEYELPPVQAKAAARKMVAQLRERNFILSRYGGEVYGFVHRAFLEYLAAADIAHRYKEDREWSPDELITNVVEQRAEDPAWHEVILLVIGQLPERDAGAAIDRLLRLHRRRRAENDNSMLVLATRALAEVRKIRALATQSRAVIESLRIAVSSSEPSGPAELAAALPALGTFNEYWTGRHHYLHWFRVLGQHLTAVADATDIALSLFLTPAESSVLARFSPTEEVRRRALRKFERFTISSPEPSSSFIQLFASAPHPEPRAAALRLLAVHFIERSETLTLLTDRATNDPHPQPRGVALSLLAAHFAEQPETLTLLTDRATNDPHPQPRGDALHALARHWTERPETLTLLTDRATNDPHEQPRGVALSLLAARFAERPETLTLLTDRATNDPHEEPRFTALQWIPSLRPQQLETLELLIGHATDDPDEDTRFVALHMVVDHFIKRPETLTLLTDRATNDPHPFPRHAALELLTENFPDLSDKAALLSDRAISDPHQIPRYAALQLLAARFAERPETLTLLTDRATNDPHEQPRGVALSLLAAHFAEQPETLTLLTDRATNDPHPQPRGDALHALARHWTERPETLTLLTDRATNDPHEQPRGVALSLLAAHFAEQPETLTLLTNRATNDPHEQPRGDALQLLTQVFLHEPETLALLTSRAKDEEIPALRLWALRAWAAASTPEDVHAVGGHAFADEDPDVRVGGAWLLAFGCPQDPRAMALLRESAQKDPHAGVRIAASEALLAAELQVSTQP